VGLKPARGGDRSLAIGTVVGVAAAVVLAVLLNVIGARHFRRWDATTQGLYTLSDATKETLRGLEEPIVVHVLLADGDPLRASIDQMLLAYRAESTRLEVRAIDPDRAPAELLAVQQKYGVVAWLASHRAFLDIPEKAAVVTHLDLTEEGLGTLFRGVVLFLPGAAALGGVLVWLARRREPVRRPASRPDRSPRS